MLPIQLTFGVLCVAVLFLLILLFPLPSQIRNALFFLIRKIQTPLIILFAISVFMLVGCVMDVRKYSGRLEDARILGKTPEILFQIQTENFRVERNLYLTGFATVILLILLRLPSLVPPPADTPRKKV